MARHHDQPIKPRKIPTWAIVAAPVLAVVISNADVLYLEIFGRHAAAGGLPATLAVTITLSLVCGGLTVALLLRLRTQVDERTAAERRAQAAADELSLALGREHLLLRELDHRVRNNLSALLALVGTYEESSGTCAEMGASLRDKVLALRESFNLMSTTHGDGVELAALLRAVIAVILGEARAHAVTIEGPSVRLTSREANAFAMIVQELLTNAAKHGALRAAGGTIRVGWQSTVSGGVARVRLRWIEEPVVDNPRSAAGGQVGIGLSLVEQFAASDLRGGVSFGRSGDRWTVELVANVKVPSPSPDAAVNMETCA